MSTPADYGRARPGRNQGVIHDLGYRHYDGPRLGRAVITRALFVESAKGAYGLGRSARSKVMPMILLAAMCLPAIIIAIVTVVTKADAPSYTAYLLNTELLVMVYVAGQAPASVSRDLRFRVISLYFSRPIRRIDYVAAKYAAMAVALLVFMVLPLTILFAGALLAKLPIGDQVPNYLRSLAGAVLLALVLAGIGLVIAALTPRRGLGVAAVIAVLAMLAGVQAAVQAIADDQGRDTFAGYAGLISPFTIVDGVQSALLGADTVLPAQPPGIAGGLVFVLAALLIVAGSFGALLMRYRKVSI
ncbi:MAG: type transport system permease protein [Pseudonocardiales bacterium]|jgi:ABC-2 type transport system permease protein|nr:type transport system permease protein [Pseudonocardiales bacterium]